MSAGSKPPAPWSLSFEPSRVSGQPLAVALSGRSAPALHGNQGEREMTMRAMKAIAAAIALSALSTMSMAQNCMQLPQGPARFACVSKKNPAAEGKLERCKQQALDMGLRPGAGMSNGPALKNYVQACMHRPG